MSDQLYLELRCISGKDLMPADSNGFSDPYLSICLGASKKKQKTRVIKKTLNPRWNELLTFVVQNPETDRVHIRVLDKDLLSSDFIGETTIDISDLIEGYEKIITTRLSSVSTGEITLGLKAVNWTGSNALGSYQQQIMNQGRVEQYPQQPQFQQPGFFNFAPNTVPQSFHFAPQVDQFVHASNPYGLVPFVAPLNAAQLIPGYYHNTSEPQASLGSVRVTTAKESVSESALREGYNIAYEEISFKNKLGTGAFGEVWKGEWAGTPVAVKKILKADINESDLGEFASEILLMSKLRHPNIVQFLGACMEPEFCLMTEFMELGSLFDVLADMSLEISWARKLNLCKDIARGMVYLHTRSPPIIHRDVKSLNVLVTKDWKATIADFGLTKIKDKAMLSTRCGSPVWSAPEVLRGEPYDESADVFSFGIVLWEIISRQRPYPNEHPMQLIGRIAFQKPSMRPPIPHCEDSSLIDLMIRCWHDDPSVRPTFEQVLERLKEIPEDLSDLAAPTASLSL